MDASNWRADRPLDVPTVAAILREQAPELAGSSIELLGAGWDSEVFLIARSWVVRFPKRAEVQPWLATERALLPHLARALPVAVPRFELFGEPGAHFPYTFVGYRLLPGVPLQECLDHPFSAAGLERMARQLGEALDALHGLDVAKLGVELRAPEPGGTAQEELAQGLGELAAIDAALARRLEHALAVFPRPHATPDPTAVPVHDDLDTEHILVDPERERITGLIDWGDVRLGTAAVDLMGAHLFGGRDFSARALSAMPRLGDDLWPWLDRLALERGLGNVTYGRLGDKPSYLQAGLRGLRLVLADLGA